MQTLDQIQLNTMQAEARLSEHVLDAELLAKERELNAELSTVNAELKPLLFDLAARRDSLQNVEFRVRQLVGKGDDHTAFDAINGYFNRGADVRKAEADVADLRNQIAQLETAVRPRQAEQQRLKNELSEIYSQKLLP
jgi:chromosome segregation ATPase